MSVGEIDPGGVCVEGDIVEGVPIITVNFSKPFGECFRADQHKLAKGELIVDPAPFISKGLL